MKSTFCVPYNLFSVCTTYDICSICPMIYVLYALWSKYSMPNTRYHYWPFHELTLFNKLWCIKCHNETQQYLILIDLLRTAFLIKSGLKDWSYLIKNNLATFRGIIFDNFLLKPWTYQFISFPRKYLIKFSMPDNIFIIFKVVVVNPTATFYLSSTFQF